MARTRILGMCALWPWRWRFYLGWRSWHTLGSCTSVVWNIIQIQHGSEELLPWHTFCYVCTVTLAFENWPWAKVMSHPSVMDNNCLKYYLDPTWQWRVISLKHILLCVHFDLDLEGMTLVQGHDTPLGNGQQLCEILSRINMAVKSYGTDTHILLFVYCDLDLWGMTLCQGHDTPLGNGQQLCDILSRSNMTVKSCCPNTHFAMCALWPWPWRYDLGLKSWHTLGHGQQLCEVLLVSRSNMTAKSYGKVAHFFLYIWSVTLTLKFWPWVKVMTHP